MSNVQFPTSNVDGNYRPKQISTLDIGHWAFDIDLSCHRRTHSRAVGSLYFVTADFNPRKNDNQVMECRRHETCDGLQRLFAHTSLGINGSSIPAQVDDVV